MSDYIVQQWRCACCRLMVPIAELVHRSGRYICRRCAYGEREP